MVDKILSPLFFPILSFLSFFFLLSFLPFLESGVLVPALGFLVALVGFFDSLVVISVSVSGVVLSDISVVKTSPDGSTPI